ncbi:MAG: DUF4864 domain-containing protein [Cyanobacteria bacterium CRU_2_1]|nr:DUF4864 domain-containing protein [Cyanobacteria bacterium RU_5_0]NJR61089.1 DUF4864 domain-containing protein [Cyanobacteria bacterium CRU_2_1]
MLPPTPTDRAIIRSIIECQLEAFGRDDSAEAFAFASPRIQAQFGTPENFMQMVKMGYSPIYHPRAVMFQDIAFVEDMPAQKVLLMGTDGELVMALYLMQKQPDGSWRIHGCFLVPVEGNSLEP